MDDWTRLKKARRPQVLLLTETFPAQEGEFSFLVPEVSRLAQDFDMILLPRIATGSARWELPSGVFLEQGLSKHLRRRSVRFVSTLKACFSTATYRELCAFGWRALSPKVLATVVIRASRMMSAREWIWNYLSRHRVDVAYSWWAFISGYGLALAARDLGIPSITRAHGFEVFDEQDRLGLVPFQRGGIAAFSRVYAVSKAGAEVLREKVPSAANRIQVRHLGVQPGPGQGFRSEDDVFRILSCSACIDVKRVDLLAAGIGELGRKYPQVLIEWTHIGDGPTLQVVHNVLSPFPATYAKCFFPGSLPPSEVRAWMSERPFDAFVNVSASEGLPVTLMEAASSGIPLIATDVGGNSEIVMEGVGHLLPRDPSPGQIADILFRFSQMSPAEISNIRLAAKHLWAERFSSERNYAEFAETLQALVSDTK